MAKRLPWNPKQRVSGKKAREEILKKVLELTKLGQTQDDIGNTLNPTKPLSRSQVWRYQSELIKRGSLERDGNTKRAIIAKKQVQITKWEKMEKEPFMQLPEVKRFWESMKQKNKGKGLTAQGEWLTKILIVMNTVDVAPKDLLMGTYMFEKEIEKNPSAEPDPLISLTHCMLKFKEHMEIGDVKYAREKEHYTIQNEKSIHGYVMAMRAFFSANNKPVPKNYGGKGHILSGAKENYGVYNDVYLSDEQKIEGIKFLRLKYNETFAVFFAFMFEMMPRTNAMYDWIPQFTFHKKEIDGFECEYAKTKIFESKTEKAWVKTIYDPIIIEMAKKVKHGQKLTDMPADKFLRSFGSALRELYVHIKLLPSEILLPKNDPKYPKFPKGTLEHYLLHHSIYTLRHSGAHMWMRRSNYSASLVAKKGWETVDILTQSYAGMPDDYELEAGTCYYCDPPQNRNTPNMIFCSPRHALIYLQNGNIPKNQALSKSLQNAIMEGQKTEETNPLIEKSENLLLMTTEPIPSMPQNIEVDAVTSDAIVTFAHSGLGEK